MTYDLIIHHVDGETVFRLYTRNRELLLPFLKAYDHEGSQVSLNTVLADSDVYTFLGVV